MEHPEAFLESLTARAAALAEQQKACALEIERLHSYNEVERAMGEYQNVHIPHDDPNRKGLPDSAEFFIRRDDSTLELVSSGVMKGWDRINASYSSVRYNYDMHGGILLEHDMCSPMIVVSEDGSCVRAVWQCWSNETNPTHRGPKAKQSDPPCGTWTWCTYRVDYLRDADGQWKMWHSHCYRHCRTLYDISWTDYLFPESFKSRKTNPHRTAAEPIDNLPTTFNQCYRDDEILPVPTCPEPFRSWTDELEPV